MVFQTIRLLCGAAPRIPAIRFRKGALHAAQNTGNFASAATHSSTQQSAAIEDWELPDRYRRKPIDAYECEYINRGGPE